MVDLNHFATFYLTCHISENHDDSSSFILYTNEKIKCQSINEMIWSLKVDNSKCLIDESYLI